MTFKFSDIVLTRGDYKTINYTKHVLGGIGADSIRDAIPYGTFLNIMNSHRKDSFLTVGSTACRFFKTIADNTDNVRDILCEVPIMNMPKIKRRKKFES